MNQPWKLILLLIGIFAAGVVAGGIATMQYERHSGSRHSSPEQWGPARLKKISERLNLTSEQQEKLRPIIRRDMEDLGRIRASSFAEGKRIFERMEHDIAEVLTPEQREKFEQMNREMRERMQKFNHDHPFGDHDGPRNHHEPPGAGDGPPPPPEKPAAGI